MFGESIPKSANRTKISIPEVVAGGGDSTKVCNIMTDDYSELEGYNSDADLGLGCGPPTQFA